MAYVNRWLSPIALYGGYRGKRGGPALRHCRKVPRLNWVFRAFYGDFYQPPPLLTATGPLLDLANSQNLTFAPLHGERDEEYQFGVTIPFRGWALDADTFETRAQNWLDHSNIGESNLFWPLTWDAALIQGLGTHAAIPPPLASRPVSPCLCESDRAGNRALHRWLDLPQPRDAVMPDFIFRRDIHRLTTTREIR